MGLRLAGIEGVIVQNGEETVAAVDKVLKDDTIGIVLMTEVACSFANEAVNEVKVNNTRPLIVEIPDRHVKQGDINASLAQYVKEAIGANL